MGCPPARAGVGWAPALRLLTRRLRQDLGHADTGIYGGDGGAAAKYTQNITALAHEGIVLTNHYVHWHCSVRAASLAVSLSAQPQALAP